MDICFSVDLDEKFGNSTTFRCLIDKLGVVYQRFQYVEHKVNGYSSPIACCLCDEYTSNYSLLIWNKPKTKLISVFLHQVSPKFMLLSDKLEQKRLILQLGEAIRQKVPIQRPIEEQRILRPRPAHVMIKENSSSKNAPSILRSSTEKKQKPEKKKAKKEKKESEIELKEIDGSSCDSSDSLKPTKPKKNQKKEKEKKKQKDKDKKKNKEKDKDKKKNKNDIEKEVESEEFKSENSSCYSYEEKDGSISKEKSRSVVLEAMNNRSNGFNEVKINEKKRKSSSSMLLEFLLEEDHYLRQKEMLQKRRSSL